MGSGGVGDRTAKVGRTHGMLGPKICNGTFIFF